MSNNNEIGMLRFTFEGKETVLERRGLRRKEIAEAIAMTLAHFAWEGEGDQRRPMPRSKVKASWVTGEGTPGEKSEPVSVDEVKTAHGN